MKVSIAFGLGGVGFLVGCAGGGIDGYAGRRADPVIVRLDATRANPGEIARAILAPHGDETDVTIEVSGVPGGTNRPVHLYTYLHEGLCDGPRPAHIVALDRRVLAQSVSNPLAVANAPPWRVTNTAPFSLAKLRARPHAITVRTARADGDVEIFCGELGK